MKQNRGKIVLIGLPGSGKSTLGKQLSLRIQCPFFDLDELIEDEIGCSIARFFQERGEQSFRLIESKILQKTLYQDSAYILSTGGGAPCFNENMKQINSQSTSIYIDVPVEVLIKRLLKNGRGERPMFAGLAEAEVIKKISGLKLQREHFYDQAKIKLSGSNITTEQILLHLGY